ncbi:MAG: hypothetical protein EOP56_03590 [Sphingobacteriales bacterium]|nr:MAG: hypothetical protein EOP56_03590 [Sphingobacteriales bacterium]
MKLRLTYILLLLLCSLSACHRGYYMQKQSSNIYAIDKAVNADSSMADMITPYKQNMQQAMEQVIGTNDTMLTKGQPESSLGNFLADAQLDAAKKADAGVIASVANYGGIRLPYITAGPITIGKMYELMPFDNTIVILDVPGNVMLEFCNHIANLGGWPVSGIRFAIKDKQAIDIEIGNAPLDTGKTYKIAVNDYMAGGGDKCSFLKTLKPKPVNVFVRDALIAYVRQQQTLRASLAKRIYYAQ